MSESPARNFCGRTSKVNVGQPQNVFIYDIITAMASSIKSDGALSGKS